MWILAQILTQITRKPRVKVLPGVDFQWSRTSWTHNLFRTYELVFWRQFGIRPEASYGPDFAQFHSVEAALAYIEAQIRLFRLPSVKKVYLPQFAPIGGFPGLKSSPYIFAIAFDAAPAAAGGGAAGTSLSWSHTCTGSNLVLWSGLLIARAATGAAPTSSTYNSVAMTILANTVFCGGPTGDIYLDYLAGPSTGANTITWNFSGTGNLGTTGYSTSFTGCAQTGIPDSSAATQNPSATNWSATTTVVASNCWMESNIVNGIGPITITAPATRRVNNGSQVFADSNATVGTGSQSIGATGGTGAWADVTASFAPSGAAAVTTTVLTLPFLGAG